MARLRVRRVAQAEIDATFHWYLDRTPRAAARFLAAVDTAIKTVATAPIRQPIIRGRLRRVLLRGFPYEARSWNLHGSD